MTRALEMDRPDKGAGRGRLRPALVLALLAYALAFQGTRGLWEPDEGRYTNVALVMLREHDFLHPRLRRDHWHYTKPPLTYWALAASMALLGRNEWAARLPNALAFVLTVLLIHGLARRLAPERPGLAPLLYATSFLPYEGANLVTTDTLLTLWETLAVYGFVRHHWGRDPARRRRGLGLMGAGFGLAFLTKGPPGLLPLLGIGFFLGWRPGRLRPLLTLPGLGLFLLLGLTWYGVVCLERPALLAYFLRWEVVARVASSVHHRNPAWYGALLIYGPTFLLGTLPWSGLFLPALARAPRLLGPAFWRDRARRDPAGLFLLLWLLVPFTVFCAARSRLPLYVLPLFVPLSVLLARRGSGRWPPEKRRAGLLAPWLVFLIGLRLAAAWVPFADDDRPLARAVRAGVRQPLDEVVLVDRPPRLGLRFYLGAEIERVDLGRRSPPDPLGQRRRTLREKLEAPDAARLFLVPAARVPAFDREVRRAGRRPVRRGQWKDLVMNSVTPPPGNEGR